MNPICRINPKESADDRYIVLFQISYFFHYMHVSEIPMNILIKQKVSLKKIKLSKVTELWVL